LITCYFCRSRINTDFFKADEYNILDTKTNFIKNPEYKNASIVQAYFNPYPSICFKNIMDFSTGELTFRANYRRSNFGKKVSVDTTATEITCYQYLGMAKILGTQNAFCGCKNRRTLLLFFTNSIVIILRPKASAILVEDLPLSVLLIKFLKNSA
jgi:hypothetical protein